MSWLDDWLSNDNYKKAQQNRNAPKFTAPVAPVKTVAPVKQRKPIQPSYMTSNSGLDAYDDGSTNPLVGKYIKPGVLLYGTAGNKYENINRPVSKGIILAKDGAFSMANNHDISFNDPKAKKMEALDNYERYKPDFIPGTSGYGDDMYSFRDGSNDVEEVVLTTPNSVSKVVKSTPKSKSSTKPKRSTKRVTTRTVRAKPTLRSNRGLGAKTLADKANAQRLSVYNIMDADNNSPGFGIDW